MSNLSDLIFAFRSAHFSEVSHPDINKLYRDISKALDLHTLSPSEREIVLELFLEKDHYLTINNVRLFKYYGIYYYHQRRYYTALGYFYRALDHDDLSVLSFIGVCYFKLKDNHKAQKYYRLAIDNGDVDALVYLGMCSDDGYLEYILEALARGSKIAVRMLAQYYFNQGNFPLASRYEQQACDEGVGNIPRLIRNYRLSRKHQLSQQNLKLHLDSLIVKARKYSLKLNLRKCFYLPIADRYYQELSAEHQQVYHQTKQQLARQEQQLTDVLEDLDQESLSYCCCHIVNLNS